MSLNYFLFNLVSLIAGLLFGAGMMISGMVDPVRVFGFLDIAGVWDASLMFVMGGALLVFAPVYLLFIRYQDKPICSSEFKLSKNNKLDKPLIAGAAIFGVGWGMSGICPGPAITAIGSGDVSILLFIISMVVGSYLGRLFSQK